MANPHGYTVYFSDGEHKAVSTFPELIKAINGPREVIKIYKGQAFPNCYPLFGSSKELDRELLDKDSSIEVIDEQYYFPRK